MVRFFPICIVYQGDFLWAKVEERHLSPSTFYVTFQQTRSSDIPDEIILKFKNRKLELTESSPMVNNEILTLVSAKIEEYLRGHPLSSDFRI